MTEQAAWDSLFEKLRAAGWTVNRYSGVAVSPVEQVVTLNITRKENA